MKTESVQSQSESELVYDWRFTANQFVFATSSLRLTTSSFIFQLNSYSYSPYVTSCLTRGWVCHLQLLLVLASAVILRSETRGTHDHLLLSQIRDSPNLEGQFPVFISPRNRVARLYPQALDSLCVASYDSQGYGGGTRPRPHTGLNPFFSAWPLIQSSGIRGKCLLLVRSHGSLCTELISRNPPPWKCVLLSQQRSDFQESTTSIFRIHGHV
jgi:hypothetical protein